MSSIIIIGFLNQAENLNHFHATRLHRTLFGASDTFPSVQLQSPVFKYNLTRAVCLYDLIRPGRGKELQSDMIGNITSAAPLTYYGQVHSPSRQRGPVD